VMIWLQNVNGLKYGILNGIITTVTDIHVFFSFSNQ
jgi:hypothetical protein